MSSILLLSAKEEQKIERMGQSENSVAISKDTSAVGTESARPNNGVYAILGLANPALQRALSKFQFTEISHLQPTFRTDPEESQIPMKDTKSG